MSVLRLNETGSTVTTAVIIIKIQYHLMVKLTFKKPIKGTYSKSSLYLVFFIQIYVTMYIQNIQCIIQHVFE